MRYSDSRSDEHRQPADKAMHEHRSFDALHSMRWLILEAAAADANLPFPVLFIEARTGAQAQA